MREDDTGEASEADEVAQAPATWENLVVGEADKALGHLIGDEELTTEGEDEVSAAHEVREEYREEHHPD